MTHLILDDKMWPEQDYVFMITLTSMIPVAWVADPCFNFMNMYRKYISK